MPRKRIYSVKNNALNEQDRLALANLLIKAGYTVKIGIEKKPGSKLNVKFVEFWEDKNE